MSTAANSYYFRRRTIGRTASPPTWACYEEIPYDDDYSTSCSEEDSCSEDDEDYIEHPSDSEQSESGKKTVARDRNVTRENNASIMNMETEGVRATDASMKEKETQRDVKGKQRAADPEPESTRGRRHRKERRPTCTLRPILTIHRSQGFVWNQVYLIHFKSWIWILKYIQDLFIPPYAKDRCAFLISLLPAECQHWHSTYLMSSLELFWCSLRCCFDLSSKCTWFYLFQLLQHRLRGRGCRDPS